MSIVDSLADKGKGFSGFEGFDQSCVCTHMKLHFSYGARIRATTDNVSHETHEKTRNIIFFVQFRGFRGHQYHKRKEKSSKGSKSFYCEYTATAPATEQGHNLR